jgi:hypothetical protein
VPYPEREENSKKEQNSLEKKKKKTRARLPRVWAPSMSDDWNCQGFFFFFPSLTVVSSGVRDSNTVLTFVAG